MKKTTRIVMLAALAAMASGLAACGEKGGDGKLKMALICLHGESSTYDANFINAFKAACEELGCEYDIKTNVGETNDCYIAAKEYAEDGYDIVFADSFDHEKFIMQAAEEYPEVQFCHATGVNAATAGLDNFGDAFASIYEGRYLAGVVAGMKLKEMDEGGKLKAENKDAQGNIKVGYVGAFPYAEVKSGYTSWFLGVRSVMPNVTMEVTFTNSWYNVGLEKTGAETLIARGAALISQHADSMGAPSACETAGVPNVSYNGSTADQCPETYLVSSKINWAPYYKYVYNQVKEGKPVAKDWTGTFATDSVQITELGKNVAAGTAEAIADVKAKLLDGTLKVFDASKFTVGGAAPTNANCAPSKQFTFNYPDGTEFIKDGYYHESEYRSAPSFDVDIDGIINLGDVPAEE